MSKPSIGGAVRYKSNGEWYEANVNRSGSFAGGSRKIPTPAIKVGMQVTVRQIPMGGQTKDTEITILRVSPASVSESDRFVYGAIDENRRQAYLASDVVRISQNTSDTEAVEDEEFNRAVDNFKKKREDARQALLSQVRKAPVQTRPNTPSAKTAAAAPPKEEIDLDGFNEDEPDDELATETAPGTPASAPALRGTSVAMPGAPGGSFSLSGAEVSLMVDALRIAIAERAGVNFRKRCGVLLSRMKSFLPRPTPPAPEVETESLNIEASNGSTEGVYGSPGSTAPTSAHS